MNATTSDIDYPFEISYSTVKEMKNITVSHFTQSPFNLKFTTIQLIDNFHVYNSSNDITLDKSVINLVKNSSFIKVGTSNIRRGGAVYLTNSNATFEDTTFDSNKAIKGGAIYFD